MESIGNIINDSIRRVDYKLTLEILIEIIIRDYTKLNIPIKITKKFISKLETIANEHQHEFILLSKLLDSDFKYFYVSFDISKETDIYVLNNIYLKLLNIMIREHISFDYDKVYIENKNFLISKKCNIDDKFVSSMINICKYMETTIIIKHIGQIDEIPTGYQINQSCTIGEYIEFYQDLIK